MNRGVYFAPLLESRPDARRLSNAASIVFFDSQSSAAAVPLLEHFSLVPLKLRQASKQAGGIVYLAA